MQVTVCDRCLKIMTDEPRMIGIDVNGKVIELAVCKECEAAFSQWLHTHHFDGTHSARRVRGTEVLTKPKRKRKPSTKKVSKTEKKTPPPQEGDAHGSSDQEGKSAPTRPSLKKAELDSKAEAMKRVAPARPKVPSI